MTRDDTLRRIANAIARAPNGADIAGMNADLTLSEMREVAAMVQAEADRVDREAQHHLAWANRERAKRPT
jgi:hypothetical protein